MTWFVRVLHKPTVINAVFSLVQKHILHGRTFDVAHLGTHWIQTGCGHRPGTHPEVGVHCYTPAARKFLAHHDASGAIGRALEDCGILPHIRAQVPTVAVLMPDVSS